MPPKKFNTKARYDSVSSSTSSVADERSGRQSERLKGKNKPLNNRKDELCKDYLNGFCHFGTSCNYIHDYTRTNQVQRDEMLDVIISDIHFIKMQVLKLQQTQDQILKRLIPECPDMSIKPQEVKQIATYQRRRSRSKSKDRARLTADRPLPNMSSLSLTAPEFFPYQNTQFAPAPTFPPYIPQGSMGPVIFMNPPTNE